MIIVLKTHSPNFDELRNLGGPYDGNHQQQQPPPAARRLHSIPETGRQFQQQAFSSPGPTQDNSVRSAHQIMDHNEAETGKKNKILHYY